MGAPQNAPSPNGKPSTPASPNYPYNPPNQDQAQQYMGAPASDPSMVWSGGRGFLPKEQWQREYNQMDPGLRASADYLRLNPGMSSYKWDRGQGPMYDGMTQDQMQQMPTPASGKAGSPRPPQYGGYMGGIDRAQNAPQLQSQPGAENEYSGIPTNVTGGGMVGGQNQSGGINQPPPFAGDQMNRRISPQGIFANQRNMMMRRPPQMIGGGSMDQPRFMPNYSQIQGDQSNRSMMLSRLLRMMR